jgi:RNA polymerase sigma-70 factor (ECF subfamily)
VCDPAGGGLEAIWDEEWERYLFNRAVENIKKQVKPDHYQLFDLYVVQKWPVRKITQTLSVNAGQVYLAKHRVSQLLKKEINKLQRDEVEPL